VRDCWLKSVAQPIFTYCPETLEPIATGLFMTPEVFENAVFPPDLAIQCPICGNTHTVDKKNCWVRTGG
jgi:hypothetical protein